jgi:ComF family protein
MLLRQQAVRKAALWKKKAVDWKGDLLHLMFPNSCLVCHTELPASLAHICPVCESELDFTYFEGFKEASVLDKLFWGRVQLATTGALLHFEKEGGTQAILHAIKYQGNVDLALEMGARFGRKLLENEKYADIDALVPVPLHPKKKYLRGYNQSELIAQGIAAATRIPLRGDLLTRGVHTESQTKKGRFMRWDNVADIFYVASNPKTLPQHIALVDDVVTTGATLEACVRKISAQWPQVRISVLSLAVAK